jgi:hypothetical protein
VEAVEHPRVERVSKLEKRVSVDGEGVVKALSKLTHQSRRFFVARMRSYQLRGPALEACLLRPEESEVRTDDLDRGPEAILARLPERAIEARVALFALERGSLAVDWSRSFRSASNAIASDSKTAPRAT